jgi:hypothetical protein
MEGTVLETGKQNCGDQTNKIGCKCNKALQDIDFDTRDDRVNRMLETLCARIQIALI